MAARKKSAKPTKQPTTRRGRPAASADAAPRPVAVGLCRCSTDRQDRSIAEQEKAIRTWAKERGARLLEVYKDEGVSGLKLSRPGLNACLEFLAKSKEKGTVVLWSRDRLVRPDDPVDGLVMERQIRYAGWELCYLTGSNATGNALVDAILGLVEHHASAEYLRKLARDSLRNVVARLKAGDVPGGKIPYGYAKAILNERGKVVRTIARTEKHRKTPFELTRLVLGDPAEVSTVRWIFDEFNRGWSSPADLADGLERRNAPRPTEKPWNKGTVREILHNQVYVGDIVWNRETTAQCVRLLGGKLSQKLALHTSRVSGQRIAWAQNDPSEHIVLKGRHPEIVSREIFARARATLAERNNRPHQPLSRRSFGLVELAFCANCGNRLMSRSTLMRGRTYRYYFCEAAGDHATRVRADVLEGAVVLALRSCVRSPGGRPTPERRQAARVLGNLEVALDVDDRPRAQAAFRALIKRIEIRSTATTVSGRTHSRLTSAKLIPHEHLRRRVPIDLQRALQEQQFLRNQRGQVGHGTPGSVDPAQAAQK